MRVRYHKNQPHVEAERKAKRTRGAASKDKRPARKPAEVHKPHRLERSQQGHRLSAAKREQRERRQAVLRFRRVLVIAGAVAAIVAVVWGIVAFAGSDSFRVSEVRVEGLRHLRQAQVMSLAAIPKDASLFAVDKGGVEKRIMGDPWVAAVKVRRSFPDTVIISVTERVPVASVDAGGAQLWVVSKDGYWLGERGVDESSTIVIRDLEKVEPDVGKKVRSRVLANAIAIVSRLTPSMLARVRLVSAPSLEKTALVTTDGIQIFIGEAEKVQQKEKIALALLHKEKGRVVYINVRVVESPTWRGLSK